jgi:hypothetical protein
MWKLGVSFDSSFNASFCTIREAHIRLRVLKGVSATATVLASQIELCDVLLAEISGIRSSLASDIRDARHGPQQLLPGPMA